MPRKNPILLRRGPLSGRINALTNYRHDGPRLKVVGDGKHDVTADFDALVMEILYGDGHDGPPCPDIVFLLDKAAAGEALDSYEREQMDGFHGRFKKLVERHNERGHGAGPSPRQQASNDEEDR